MKKLFLPLLCTLTFSVSQAATINWSAQDDVGLANASSGALAAGSLVRLGYFTISDAAVQAAANDLSLLSASWHSIAETYVGVGYGGNAAGIGGDNGIFTTTSSPTLAGAELGHQVYIWALNAPTVLEATQQAIFYEPSTSNANWNLPGSNLGSTTLDVGQAKTASGGVYLVGAFQPSNAALTTIIGSPSGAVQLQSINAVPEPSRMFLILAGSGLVMFRRRRRC